jgi:hypothetical protein
VVGGGGAYWWYLLLAPPHTRTCTTNTSPGLLHSVFASDEHITTKVQHVPCPSPIPHIPGGVLQRV